MKPKDRVVHATDRITEALSALVRIDYDNDIQTWRNATSARRLLLDAAKVLDPIVVELEGLK